MFLMEYLPLPSAKASFPQLQVIFIFAHEALIPELYFLYKLHTTFAVILILG